MYILLTLGAILVIFLAMRLLLRHARVSIRQYLAISTITVVAIALIVLGVTGRLPFIAAVAGAVLPFVGRVATLFRLIPLVRFLSGKRGWIGGFGARPASSGNQSTVQTRFITMVLDHDSGRMDGDVLEGRFRGRHLADLQLAELLELLNECRGDPDSVNVLQAFLDRTQPDWREKAGSQRNDDAPGARDQGTMNERHALEILGLSAGASKEEIVVAHRKLVQKLHPDRGGSTYLAARINEAKDFLLR